MHKEQKTNKRKTITKYKQWTGLLMFHAQEYTPILFNILMKKKTTHTISLL